MNRRRQLLLGLGHGATATMPRPAPSAGRRTAGPAFGKRQDGDCRGFAVGRRRPCLAQTQCRSAVSQTCLWQEVVATAGLRSGATARMPRPDPRRGCLDRPLRPFGRGPRRLSVTVSRPRLGRSFQPVVSAAGLGRPPRPPVWGMVRSGGVQNCDPNVSAPVRRPAYGRCDGVQPVMMAGSLTPIAPVSTCPAKRRRNVLSESETTDTSYQLELPRRSTVNLTVAPARTLSTCGFPP